MDGNEPVYVISVAAKLAGMHAQTLRQYDRMGLVSPSRLNGKSRRYSHQDIELLRQVQALSQEGVSLEGIRRILQLEHQLLQLQDAMETKTRELEGLKISSAGLRVFVAGSPGDSDIVAIKLGERPKARARSTALLE